ncbi:MAG: phosphoadenosine phosphosulfate reductase family protein, partial [Oscillospiraceae bacterium]|nr:phosphoadenosine phosphosulfate reductase family protein [Oscillospiraceae bacterium]
MTKNQENKDVFCSISLSGGKDSTAMLLLMLEKDMPIDCVLYADTTMEFPEMEAHIAKLDDLLCRERGIHITTLR